MTRLLQMVLSAIIVASSLSGTSKAQAEAIGFEDAQLLAALENSYWIGSDPPKRKHVYVLVAPWCPICRQQHKALTAKDLTGKAAEIEFRFILTAPKTPAERDQLGRVTAARSASALEAIYQAPARQSVAAPLTAAELFASGYNDALWAAINPALQKRTPQTIGFPAFVYASGGKAKVVVGDLGDKDTLASAVDERASATPAFNAPSPLAVPVVLKAIEPKPKFAKADGVTVYLAPHPKATKLATAKAGAGFLAKSTVESEGETWYVFQYFANGPPSAYGRVSDFR
ncbi:MAG: hypothetical protein ABL901_07785 [Hyphomicrobiaceae bacterium]